MLDVKKSSLPKITAHLVFWLINLCIILFLYFYNENKILFNLTAFTKAFILNLGFALAVYVNLYVLIPRVLKKKYYIFYVFWLVLLLTTSSILIQLLIIHPLPDFHNFRNSVHSFDSNLHAAYFFASFLYVALSSFIKFIKDWLTLQDLNLKLAKFEQQKLEAELKTLKGQLNPHFLFNSLNNIYSLALMKSEKVPGLILTLAELMRHIIYDSRGNYISLEKEIEFVNNFIAMQKLRVTEQAQISYVMNGKVPSANIAPLLFEPFIDNAFKHGLPGIHGNDFIRISVDFSVPEWLSFCIENNFEPEENLSRTNGIGISNVKQRLLHLYDPSEYQLKIIQNNHIHTVKLRLKLK